MTAATAFDTHHDDVIHDAQCDFYGRRLATASSDRTVRIFQINQDRSETLISVLSGHEGPVWQVAWAHPKFGSIIATCSYDGSVIVWKEHKSEGKGNPINWIKLREHKVHESSVNSICFAPAKYGLMLACGSSDGSISILSSDDEGSWQSKVFKGHESGCNCVAWDPSAQKQMGPRLASGGCDNLIKIWGLNDGTQEWKVESVLSRHSDWVRDICWDPNQLSTCSQKLISCSQDNTVLIWHKDKSASSWTHKFLRPDPFPDTLWRVTFSQYGNLLAVSCGDNTVTVWRENPDSEEWECVAKIDESFSEGLNIQESALGPDSLELFTGPLETSSPPISPSIPPFERLKSGINPISLTAQHSPTLVHTQLLQRPSLTPISTSTIQPKPVEPLHENSKDSSLTTKNLIPFPVPGSLNENATKFQFEPVKPLSNPLLELSKISPYSPQVPFVPPTPFILDGTGQLEGSPLLPFDESSYQQQFYEPPKFELGPLQDPTIPSPTFSEDSTSASLKNETEIEPNSPPNRLSSVI